MSMSLNLVKIKPKGINIKYHGSIPAKDSWHSSKIIRADEKNFFYWSHFIHDILDGWF